MKIFSIFCILLFLQNGFSQIYIAGETYFGENNFIEYRAGSFPIIISAPHGGTLEPSEIPDRNCSGCSTIRDFATDDLAEKMYDAIFEEFGCYPHVIINRLHRIKLDANREIVEAANGNPLAEQAWNEFHDFIEASKNSVNTQFEKGIYLDLHGHGHDIQRLELGYLISKATLQMSDAVLNDETNIESSSILNLVNDNLEGLNFAELLRGANSFGEFYEMENYPAVPSQTDPFPIGDEPYFSGGYNTSRHGSRDDGSIDGIQIECNREGVRDTEAQRLAFAASTATVLKNYLETHYFGIGGLENNCESVSSDFLNNAFSISISPNPVEDFLKIEIENFDNTNLKMKVYNQVGRVLFESKTNESQQIISTVSYTHLRSPRDQRGSRMPSSA